MTDLPTLPRLHLVASSIDAFTCLDTLSLDDGFGELFESLSERAAELLDRSVLTAASAWELAQYTDMADAGYGNTHSVLYQRVATRLAAFVNANLDKPAVRSMFNRTASLSKMVDWVLDQAAMDSVPNTLALAA